MSSEIWLGDSHKDECRPLLHLCRSGLRLLGNTEGVDSFFSLCHCSVTQACPTLWNSMDWSMSGFPVLHCLPGFLKFMFIELMMPSNHLILCHPLLLLPSILPSIKVLSNELTLQIRWPKYRSFSFSITLPMNIQDWFPLGLTGLISLLSKGLSRVFSSTTVWRHQFFSAQPCLWSNSHFPW